MKNNIRKTDKSSQAATGRPTAESLGQAGIVSLMTTILVGILLMTIAIGAVGVIVSEQRQAINSDLSTRAYYAAEAGVEDAIAEVIANQGDPPPGRETCAGTPTPEPMAGGGAEITCKIISRTSNEPTTYLAPNESHQLDLSTETVTRVKISWNQRADRSSGAQLRDVQFRDPFCSGFTDGDVPAFLPELSGWPACAPALMEAMLISHPDNINSLDQITNDEYFFKPEIFNASPPGGNPEVGQGALNTSLPNDARCYTQVGNGEYNCSVTIRLNDPTRNHVLRLKPRYKGTNVKIEVFTGAAASASSVSIIDEFITIDVTARSNDVYRRVISKLSIAGRNEQGQAGINVLDHVIFSDDSICKDFRVEPDSSNDLSTGPLGCTRPY